MLKPSLLVCAIFGVAIAQPPSPFISFSSGGPPSSQSSSPFGHGGPSSSPFGHGGPSSSPFGYGGGPPGPPPQGRPGGRFPPSPSYKPRQNGPSKLFSWLGNTMSKLPSFVPKIQYHSKPKPGGSLSTAAQNGAPTYFSSGGGPPRQSLIIPQIPNSIFEDASVPFGGNTVSFAPSHSGPIQHSPVSYRPQSGPPPPSYSSRPGPPPPPQYASRPSSTFGSRPPPQFASGGPPSFSSVPPTYLTSSSPYASSSPFSSSNVYSSPSQSLRENLEVFPSRQVSYQSQTLSQNEPGFSEVLTGGLQNLYSSQSNSKPSYYSGGVGAGGDQSIHTNYEQESSYSQSQPQQLSRDNYGATFHSIEPISIAPMFDIQNFKASASDLSAAGSNSQQKSQQQQQQQQNIHDTPFTSLISQYSAQADAATSGSEQSVMSSLQTGDLATAASSNAIPGLQMSLGQGGESHPGVFEVVAGPDAPTYDGHPVDLSKLISMIEPGAEIDTLPQYGDASMGAAGSEQQPSYAAAPSTIDLESDAAMASGGLSVSGKKGTANKPGLTTQAIIKTNDNNVKGYNVVDELMAEPSEAKPSILKVDGSRLDSGDDDKVIKEHFDKEIILDDLQDNKDKGFIIVRMTSDDETGDIIVNGTNRNGTLINNDELLAIVQQLRHSASLHHHGKEFSLLNSLSNNNHPPPPPPTDQSNSTGAGAPLPLLHPNHNYNPSPNNNNNITSPKISLDKTTSDSDEVRTSDDTDNGHDDAPVINPIYDSVRPPLYSTSSSQSVSVVDDDTDDDSSYPDDMVIESAGDLAASASRNVKSVAIIVTPPPNYVKIRNKYKKVLPQGRSASSSSTSTPSPSSSSVLTPPPPSTSVETSESSSNPNHHQTSNNNNSNSSNNDSSMLPTTPSSSLQVVDSPVVVNDSILKSISTISSSSISSTNGTNNESNNKKPHRYPVYRGKSSNNSNNNSNPAAA